MAQKKQMGAAEGLKLKQAEQDIANGKTLADVIAELKRCNETACKKEVNEIKDSQKMGAAEGLKLKKAEQDIANGKTLKEVLEELRKSNAEKKAKEKIEETLDEVDKTTKQTLNEVTGKTKKESVTLEQQIETARETAKQTGLLERIEENTRNKTTALAEKDKSGFDFGKLFTGLKVIGALTALGAAAWGLYEAFTKGKQYVTNLFGGGASSDRSLTENIGKGAQVAAPAVGAIKTIKPIAQGVLRQKEIGWGSDKLVKEAQADLAKAQANEAKVKEAHAAKPTKGSEAKVNSAEKTTAKAQAGVDLANEMKQTAKPSMGPTAARAAKSAIPGKVIGPTFGIVTAITAYANGDSVGSAATQAVGAVGGMAVGAATGAASGTVAGGGLLSFITAPAGAYVGGYVGSILGQHWARQYYNGEELTFPPLSDFDPRFSVDDIMDQINKICVAFGVTPPFDQAEIDDARKKRAILEKGPAKIALHWRDGGVQKERGKWLHTKKDSTGRAKTVVISDPKDIKELEALSKQQTAVANNATDSNGVPIVSVKATSTIEKPKEVAEAEKKTQEAEARLATAESVAKEESAKVSTAEPVTAAIEAKDGEGVFGTIVSVLRSIGVGIESIVSLMSGGAAAATSAIASGISNAASSITKSTSEHINKAKSITSGTPENAAIAMDFFKNKGWSRNQAAAIVGNLQQESTANLDPKSNRGPNTGYGIAQWIPGDRQDKFKEVIGKDIRESSLHDQLEFVDWELKNSEKASGKELKGLDDVTSATVHVATNYERTPTDHGKRVNNAKLLAAKDASSSAAGASSSIKASNATAGGGSSDLRFAAGKNDAGTNPAVFAKLRQVQQSTGINFLITSAYRSKEKNKGAVNSQHIYGRAVDVTFGGGQEATIKAIQAASAAGFTGIGVYRAGALHFDIRPSGRVCWGPDYHAGSIPAWARKVCADHVAGKISSGGVIDNIADTIKDPNSRTNAGMDVVGKAGANVGESIGEEVDSLLGTTGGASIGADWGAAMGKILGGSAGAPLDIMNSILKDIPIRGIPLKEGPYSPGTTIPTNINGKGKFSQSMTSAADLIGASNRNEDIKSNKASKPVTISNPFIDIGNNSAQAPVMASYPTRNTDPTLMKYLDMLMGV